MVWQELKNIYKEFVQQFFVDNKWLSACLNAENLRAKSGRLSAIISCGFKKIAEIFKNHSFELIYSFFGFITHSYLFVILLLFFFQTHGSKNFINLVDSLSEPYLGIIGIYLVLKEVGIRTGRQKPHRVWGEAFVAVWVMLLFLSSALTFLSESYHVDEVYRLIVTNSLASLIIRMGTLFKY